MQSQNACLSLGIDIGSTTIKYALIDGNKKIVAARYERHKSAVVQTLKWLLSDLIAHYDCQKAFVRLSGSGALILAGATGTGFVQEVVAAGTYLHENDPLLDVAVELGGEDAKIIYLTQGVELRMNEACAGGTGAFIDQMASLLDTDPIGLNELAADAKRSHPIASRCGVFAKTDVVALLNSGVPRSEIARSIFEAVADQAISGLACGRPIEGRVAFLGGPLHFLPQLASAFERKLKADKTTFEHFDNSQYAVAYGAAVDAFENTKDEETTLEEFLEKLAPINTIAGESAHLAPFFKNQQELDSFKKRHAAHCAKRGQLQDASGDLFLGIDLGSTTVKLVLIDQDGAILYDWYNHNEGDPLPKLIPQVLALTSALPNKARVRAICTTGYGASLAQAALGSQFNEVETLAHQRAAVAFDPQTSYVIDIGGQDMKCLKVTAGAIADVKLNEACSSGCGSFIETYAKQLGLTLHEFVDSALHAQNPCDLGTRCTVFMNSKVKQAQSAGATVADIAAGLCHSIVLNALHKVLRIADTKQLGEHVLVQGGTFLNDAILRAFELYIGRQVIRPDIAGLMGAYGAALIARERTTADTPLLDLSPKALDLSGVKTTEFRCKSCNNHCLLTLHRFASGQKHVSGNRCDFALKGIEGKNSEHFIDKKCSLLFNREPLPENEAPRGTIGIARVLNIYEHYPYWFELFTKLGFHVELSPYSDHYIAGLGIESIPSQSLCLPAKLAHGHVTWLAKKGLKRIWLPCIPKERANFANVPGRFACPVVGGYPEALKLNFECTHPEAKLLTPFVDLNEAKTVQRAISEAFPEIPIAQIREAVQSAEAAQQTYQRQVRQMGEKCWREHEVSKAPLVVIASHPYHMDPFVNHGICTLIASMGVEIVTEDSIAHLAPDTTSLDVIDQWTFHSRLYRAAELTRDKPWAELVHLVSFGCGLDAITSEQVRRILEPAGKLYTMLKIDEGDTLGAARIRLRSLFAAVKDRREMHAGIQESPIVWHDRPKEKKKLDLKAVKTIYVPQMAPIHFPILESALKSLGFNVKLLPQVRPEAIQLGLRYVNNDACYPAIVVIGQLLDAVLSKDFDQQTSALLLAQTCGPCRATNYATLLKWALKDLDMQELPVITISTQKVSGTEHLPLGLKGINRIALGVLYGDLLQKLYLKTRSYETIPGSAQKLLEKWQAVACRDIDKGKSALRVNASQMAREFAAIECTDTPKPQVGIVGEILLKYHPQANLNILEELFAEGAEPRLGDISSFLLYCLYDPIFQAKALKGPKMRALTSGLFVQYFESLRSIANEALCQAGFKAMPTLKEHLARLNSLMSPAQQAGEGWLLTAEMVEFLETGAPNVLCLQPFACLPNHITGKGVMRVLRQLYPNANLCAIDFEAGTSHANFSNRLKLFMAQARDNQSKRTAAKGL